LVTLPLKNVRKRHFRKVNRDEMGEEVRHLFRADYEVECKVIYDNDQQIEVSKQIEKIRLEHNDLFGGALSQSDEE
ncbi:unnamed protein product, partial [Rotaria sordida]